MKEQYNSLITGLLHLIKPNEAGERTFLRTHWRWLAALLYLLSGVYFVAADQQAIVLRFGQVVEKRVLPGIHWACSYPIDSVIKLKALETKRLTVGLELPDQVLGRTAAENRAEYLTGDQNLIQVQLAVQYQVKDAPQFLFATQDNQRLITSSVESAFVETIAGGRVDEVLTTGKVAVQNATYQRAQALLDQSASGVFLSSINIEQVAPPAEVADAFREVAGARADRDRIINEAHGYANDLVPKAKGEADKLMSDAQGYRQQRINEAEGDAARFEKLLAEARHAKDVTEKRLYLEAMEEILPRIKKVIIDSHGPQSLMDLGIIKPNP